MFYICNVKHIFKIHKLQSWWFVVGLTLFILVAPCKVRQFIQSELGLPITEVSNKSQTTVNSLKCVSYEVSASIEIGVKPYSVAVPVFFASVPSFSANSIAREPLRGKESSLNKIPSLVPLYILYQNLKIYS